MEQAAEIQPRGDPTAPSAENRCRHRRLFLPLYMILQRVIYEYHDKQTAGFRRSRRPRPCLPAVFTVHPGATASSSSPQTSSPGGGSLRHSRHRHRRLNQDTRNESCQRYGDPRCLKLPTTAPATPASVGADFTTTGRPKRNPTLDRHQDIKCESVKDICCTCVMFYVLLC